MKHRCRCSCREQRKLTVLMFGPTPPASSRTWQRWFMTSAPAVRESMLATSCKTGRVSWSVMILAATKASFELGVTEIGCMAHARRKFFELHATNKSMLAEQALHYIQLLYEIESEVRDLEPDLRRRIRQEKAVPVMNMLHAWMIAQRDLVPEGSATSRALDYSLKRWAALSRYLDDGAVPIDNNWCEVRHEVAYRSCSSLREPPVSPGESRRLNQERL